MSKENQMTKSSERRRYERYMAMIQTKVDEKSPIEINVDGVTVYLVDFALAVCMSWPTNASPWGKRSLLSSVWEKKEPLRCWVPWSG